jgi:AraC-like DNA-binding protein
VLAALVAAQGDLYSTEYARRFAERTGTPPLSAAAICRRALARLGLRRQKRRSTRE